MKKTQDLLRRAGAAALALTMTVGFCQPAFAATKAPFSKDETVYAVMAADGSVQKTPSASTSTLPTVSPVWRTSPP